MPSRRHRFDRTISPEPQDLDGGRGVQAGRRGYQEASAFKKSDPRGYGELMSPLVKGGGFPVAQRERYEDVLWVERLDLRLDILDVEDLHAPRWRSEEDDLHVRLTSRRIFSRI